MNGSVLVDMRGWRGWLGVVGVAAMLALGATPASAAFAGRNGKLVIAPAHGGGLVVAPSRGGRVTRVCDAPQRCGEQPGAPHFSPDGKEIVFADAQSRIEIATVAGTCLWCLDSRPLTSLPGADPSFTPDGTAVTFVHHGLWKLTLGEAAPRRILRGPVSAAAWSPSDELAVVRNGWVWSGNWRAGGAASLRRVARGSGPAWSPDGRELAFIRKGVVFVTAIGAKRLTRIARGTAPTFSPDGTTLAYLAPSHAVVLRPLTAASPRARILPHLQGRSIDWQPITPATTQSCANAHGAVVASTARATIRASVDLKRSHIGWNGCLTALGIPFHLNGGSDGNGYNLNLGHVALAGDYAALQFVYTDKYMNYTDTVNVYDLRTGARVRSTQVPCQFQNRPCGVTALAVNRDGFAAWVATDAPELPESNMDAISCPTTTLCVADDQNGHLLVSTSPLGGPSAWTRVYLAADTTSMGGISCPTAGFCVLVASNGNAYWSTDPTGGAAAWHAVPLASYALSDVSCASVALCVAVGGGTVWTTTDPTGPAGAWRPQYLTSGTPLFLPVSCASSKLCVIGDSAGNLRVSTDPADPSPSWTTDHVSSDVVNSISCPTTALCALVTGGGGGAVVLTSTDPADATPVWAAHSLNAPMGSVTCAEIALCLAFGENTTLTTTDPTDPSPSWTAATIAQGPTAASCPTANECVAVGGPDILTSTDPTGGASSWARIRVDALPCAPCLAETLTAIDDHGTHTLDTAPSGPGTVIDNLRFTGPTLTWAHDGAPRQSGLS